MYCLFKPHDCLHVVAKNECARAYVPAYVSGIQKANPDAKRENCESARVKMRKMLVERVALKRKVELL